jgi:hypothetical protein
MVGWLVGTGVGHPILSPSHLEFEHLILHLKKIHLVPPKAVYLNIYHWCDNFYYFLLSAACIAR